MSSSPAVIVNKGGMFTALVKGIFGLAMTLVICVTVLGVLGITTVNSNVGRILEGGFGSVSAILDGSAEWQSILPPAIADAVNDRRDIGYLENLGVAGTFVSVDEEEGSVAIEVTNNGDKIVSLMTVRVLLADDSVPSAEFVVPVATPLSIDCDEGWRGPLLPGATRKIIEPVWRVHGEPELSYEVTEVRVWAGPIERDAQLAAPAPEVAVEASAE